MNRKNILQLIAYSLFLILLSSGITYWMTSHQLISPASITITSPKSNCEIRNWYNFQVIAIDQLNQYWISQGISLKDRAQKAYSLRHNARKQARFMMQNKIEVKALKERDIARYGNPDGPTFEYLLQKNQEEGQSLSEAYENIIQSAKKTNSRYNAECAQ